LNEPHQSHAPVIQAARIGGLSREEGYALAVDRAERGVA
jgi:hypothetical protein